MRVVTFLSILLNMILLGVIFFFPKDERELMQGRRVAVKQYDQGAITELTEDTESLLKQLSEDWSLDDFWKHTSPEMQQITGREKLSKTVDVYAALGGYKRFVDIKTMGHPDRPQSVMVIINAVFEKGTGMVSLVLTEDRNPRLIEAINIDSNLF